MPKYILHGGAEHYPSPMNDTFYNQLALEVPDNGQCLITYFSSDSSTWSAKFARDSKRILDFALKQGKNIKCTCGSLENFEKELKVSDVIYFSGGNSVTQMKNSKQFKELLLKDKIFAGSSSGAYLMGCKFRTTRTPEVLEGTGILPFNIQAHADNPEYAALKAELISISTKGCPLITIREGDFTILEY